MANKKTKRYLDILEPLTYTRGDGQEITRHFGEYMRELTKDQRFLGDLDNVEHGLEIRAAIDEAEALGQSEYAIGIGGVQLLKDAAKAPRWGAGRLTVTYTDEIYDLMPFARHVIEGWRNESRSAREPLDAPGKPDVAD